MKLKNRSSVRPHACWLIDNGTAIHQNMIAGFGYAGGDIAIKGGGCRAVCDNCGPEWIVAVATQDEMMQLEVDGDGESFWFGSSRHGDGKMGIAKTYGLGLTFFCVCCYMG